MSIKATVTSEEFDGLSEALQELYEKASDGSYKLSVEGQASSDEAAGLREAIRKLKHDNRSLKEQAARALPEEDLTELERLRKAEAEREEKKAKDEGRWEELRAKLLDEKAKEAEKLQAEIAERDSVIEKLTVTNQLRAAITEAGVDPQYQRAAELLLKERGPRVEWEQGKDPLGVFPDELHGDKPIADYVKEWAASDEASPYMPREVGAGGGGTGEEANGKVATDKPWGEMSMDERVAFTEAKYGAGASA